MAKIVIEEKQEDGSYLPVRAVEILQEDGKTTIEEIPVELLVKDTDTGIYTFPTVAEIASFEVAR